MFLRICAMLFGWELVLLRDFEGDTYLTKVSYDAYGKWAYVYHWTQVGRVILNDDFSCGRSFYIKTWKWAQFTRQKIKVAGNSAPNKQSVAQG